MAWNLSWRCTRETKKLFPQSPQLTSTKNMSISISFLQNATSDDCSAHEEKWKNRKLQTAQTCKHANTASMLLPQALRCMLGQLFATKVSVLLSPAHQICGVASATQVVTSHHKSQFPASWSEVQRVRLSRKSCMIKVESL